MSGQLFRLLRAASVNLPSTPVMSAGSRAPVRGGGLILRIPLAVALAAASCCLVAAPASASENQVSGIQSTATASVCGEPSLGSYTMTGGLIGCWYTDTFNPKKSNASASGKYQVIYTGTEHFTGCLDSDRDGGCSGDPTGTFYTTFTFTAQYDALTLEEIRGRCHHPIVSGTGDFAGATGVINFKDDISNGTSPYMGHVGF